MHGGVFAEIGVSEFEQRRAGAKAFLLQMYKRARQLNEPLEKVPIRPASVLEPEFLQHIVRFVKQLLIEAIEKAQIMGVQFPTLKGGDPRGNFPAFFAHPGSVATWRGGPK
jgi:hypothetical protein